ncbi:MAG TPA: ABC transporter permease [Bacteroidales bacterium]|nr:ABC transporter permease [Bacteroidales bacterium]
MTITKLVLIELWKRKSQLITGLLAITLGIAVIVAIQSVAVVSEQNVAKNLDNLGANILVLPQAASIDDYYTSDIDAPTLPIDYVERILESTIAGVDNMSPKLTRRVSVNGKSVVLTGILPKSEIASKPLWQSSGLLGKQLTTSCAPSQTANQSHGMEDEKLKRKAIDTLYSEDCMAGSQVAKKLSLTANKKINILGKEFMVVKVLPETGTVDDDRIFANLKDVQALLKIENQVSAIEIMGCCNAISEGLLGQLRNILPDTRVTSINQIVSTQIETNQLMRKVTLVMLIIIFFVGGISIGNYIWANVNERKREIGILRMMGAERMTIYKMFLLKALLLGIAGGILGFLLGTLAGVILGPYLAGIVVKPLYIYLVWSILLSITIALAGSLIPTYLAAKFDPHSNLQED